MRTSDSRSLLRMCSGMESQVRTRPQAGRQWQRPVEARADRRERGEGVRGRRVEGRRCRWRGREHRGRGGRRGRCRGRRRRGGGGSRGRGGVEGALALPAVRVDLLLLVGHELGLLRVGIALGLGKLLPRLAQQNGDSPAIEDNVVKRS